MPYGQAGATITGNPPICVVRRQASQSLTTGVGAAIAWDNEDVDTDTMHDTVTNPSRITIKTAGVYVVTAGAFFATNGTGYREIYMLVGGVTLYGGITLPGNATNGPAASFSRTLKFAVNDWFEVFALQTSGGNLNIAGDGHWRTVCSATWVGLGT